MTFINSSIAIAQETRLSDTKKSAVLRFLDWATKEDEVHHIGWVGLSVTAMTAVFFPLTMFSILMNGGLFGLIIVAMIALVLVFTTNVAALSTRYTIPVFILCVLTDLIVILISIFAK